MDQFAEQNLCGHRLLFNFIHVSFFRCWLIGVALLLRGSFFIRINLISTYNEQKKEGVIVFIIIIFKIVFIKVDCSRDVEPKCPKCKTTVFLDLFGEED
ncbi:hypothetical protein P8452_57509 [Trifolium repens]|nr:hypothetical protein P8452_57509 [Trifolium repens]